MKVNKSCPLCGAVLKLDSTANGVLSCPKCKGRVHTRDLKDIPSIVVRCPQCAASLRSYTQKPDFRMRCGKCGYEGALATYGRLDKDVVVSPQGGVRDGHTQINIPQGGLGVTPAQNRGGDTEVQGASTVIDSSTELGHKPLVYARPLSLRLHSELAESLWYGDKELPRLKEGRQVVGRVGKGVDVECLTRDLYFSRTHFAILVEYLAARGTYRHYLCHNGHQNSISLRQNGGVWVEVGKNDMPVLNAGDHIRVGHTVLEVYYNTAK